MFLKNIGRFKYLEMFLPFWLFLTVFKFGSCLHYDLMSPYGERVFPIWIVGLIIGIASFIQFILDVPAGFILDKYGYRKFLKITTVIFMIAALFLVFKLNVWTYLLTIFVSCFGWLFFGPGVNAYVISHSPIEDAGKFISLRDVFESVGVVFGTAFLIFTLYLPVQIVGIIIFLILGLALILISIAPKDIESVHKEKKISTQHYYIKRQYLIKVIMAISKLNPASVMLLLTGFSSSIFYALIWFVVPLMLAHSISPGVMSYSLGVFDFAIIMVGFFIGKIADRINKRLLVFFGLLLFSVMGMLLGFNFGIAFLFFGFLATIGDEMSTISLWLWLNSLDKDHVDDGLVSGVINLFQDLGWAIGPIIAGFLYFKIGPEWTITIGGCFVLIVWLLYTFKFRKIHSQFDIDSSLVPKKPHKFRSKR
jgi:MFS family permease